MYLQIRQFWVRGVTLLLLSVLAAGCLHFAPLPYAGQRDEARALGKTLKSLTPEARAERLKEHTVARELRITLDELAKLPREEFTERFNSYTEQLTAIQKKQRELEQALGGRSWSSPMVQAVQQGAIKQMQQDMERNEKWLELAKGVRLRVQLGREEGFPELSQLSHQLDIFLATKSDLDPFANRIHALQGAFGLSDVDLI